MNTEEEERIRLIDERLSLNLEKIDFLKEKEIILKEIINVKDELRDLEEICNICRICFKNQKIQLGCCSGGICYRCWDKHESRSPLGEGSSTITKCPFCRSPLPRLVDILINKFEKLNK